jgi:hypothetical protein
MRYVAGSVIGLTGVAYVVLEYVPSIEPPQNMRYVRCRRSSGSPDSDITTGMQMLAGAENKFDSA